MLELITIIFFLLIIIRILSKKNYFELNKNMKIYRVKDDVYLIDDFYKYPNKIRNMYINKRFKNHISIYTTKYFNPRLYDSSEHIEFFSKLMKTIITRTLWNDNVKKNSNGYIQYMTKDSMPVLHTDTVAKFGAVIYLGDNDHSEYGTSFYKHKDTGLEIIPSDAEFDKLSEKKKRLYDYYYKNHYWAEGEKPKFDKWEKIYTAKNKFNSAVVFNSRRFHCADGGYGTNIKDSRMFQTFFF